METLNTMITETEPTVYRSDVQIVEIRPDIDMVENLRLFLVNAPKNFASGVMIKKFPLQDNEFVSCVLWEGTFYMTGTDIIRTLSFRFESVGRHVTNMKKFEEGVFSDLRNLKPGVDASLEGPKSKFLEMLFDNMCVRTKKKQKVFYWFSVPHETLFMVSLLFFTIASRIR